MDLNLFCYFGTEAEISLLMLSEFEQIDFYSP